MANKQQFKEAIKLEVTKVMMVKCQQTHSADASGQVTWLYTQGHMAAGKINVLPKSRFLNELHW